MNYTHYRKINIYTPLFLLLLFFACSSTTFAGRYYNRSEMANYSVADSLAGQTFYVDTENGLDTNDGLSTDTSFKTIARALDRYRSNKVMGGDVIKIKAGIYREQVNLTMVSDQIDSLSQDTPLVIGPYGDGEVIIDPSNTPLYWSAYDANIFVADWTHAKAPWAVIMDDDFKSFRDKQSLTEVTGYGLWFYDDNTKKIYVHTSGANPQSLDPIITFSDRYAEHYGIKINGISNIHIYGLTIRGASRYGITDYPGGDNIRVEKCTIHFNNNTGMRVFGRYPQFIKNHIWGNVLYNWPRGRTWGADGSWGMGATFSHFGLAKGNIVHDNGGEGLGNYGGEGHSVYEDNISYDNYSVGIYLDNTPYVEVRKNLVYSRNPSTSDLAEPWQLPQWIQDAGEPTITTQTNKIFARMRQEGIMLGDETETNPTARSIGHKVYNNIIIGARRGFLTYGQATGSGLKNYLIANNTIILPSGSSTYGEYAGIVLDSDNPNNIGTVVTGNIVYSSTNEPLVRAHSAAFTGIETDNNLYYAPNNSTPFRINSSDYGFSDWQSSLSKDNDVESLFENPLFTGTVGSFSPQDYSLAANSPAIAKAKSLVDFTEDYFSAKRGKNWDIGAIEFNTSDTYSILLNIAHILAAQSSVKSAP